jgi:gas vesicle protein
MSQTDSGYGGVIALAFVAGALIGAGTGLLLAPEPGRSMRRRLAHGADAAQEELSGVAAETREALGALTKDARQTLRQTASRLGAALDAAREALKSDIASRPRAAGLRRIRKIRNGNHE